MVTTTVREGTRRRWGEVNRYLFGGTKSYSTTTTRTRYADGTVVTTTGDTYGALKGGLLLLVVVIALLVGLLGGGGGGSNKARVALHIAARGYWLVGADGGVFTFGDAHSYGSLPAMKLKVRDVVGVVADLLTQASG